MSGMERRTFFGAQTELRAGADGARSLAGHAAVFDQYYDTYGYREKIGRGAFATSLGRDDVRALFNHDANLVLGRTASGTLALAEDAVGLAFSCTPPDTQYARDLAAVIGRGDVTGCSISFLTRQDAWNKVAGVWERTLLELDLIDVGPVTFPAYTQTDVALRSAAGLYVPRPPDDAWKTTQQHLRARLALAEAEV